MFDLHVRNEEREERREAGGRRRRQVIGRQVASKAMFAYEQRSLPGCVKTGAFPSFPAFAWSDGVFRGSRGLHLLVRIPHLVHLLPGGETRCRRRWWWPYLNERRQVGNVRQGEE